MSSAAPARTAALPLFYAAYFVVMGVQLPFWPTWLAAQGLSKVQIGILISAGVWARALANPLLAQRADHRGERRRPMIALAWISAGVFALFALPGGGFWWLLLISLGFGVFYAPLLALGESLTLLSVPGRSMARYGRIRLWGSLTFIVAASASGQIIEAHGVSLVLGLMLGALLVLAVICHLLPDVRPDAGQAVARGPLRRLLRTPNFVFFLLSVGAVQASHALYYAFGTLHWRSAGHPEGAIGWLWAEGVLAEIVLFASAPLVVRRLDPLQLLGLGAAAGVLRWTVTACTTDYTALLLVQPLHALTYGATHMGAVLLIGSRVLPGASATAQSLYGGIANGAAMGLVLLAIGPLFESAGGRAFAVMAALSAVGGLGVVALAWRERGQGPVPAKFG